MRTCPSSEANPPPTPLKAPHLRSSSPHLFSSHHCSPTSVTSLFPYPYSLLKLYSTPHPQFPSSCNCPAVKSHHIKHRPMVSECQITAVSACTKWECMFKCTVNSGEPGSECMCVCASLYVCVCACFTEWKDAVIQYTQECRV